ncbi:MAG TPA: MMPL family transporter [Jiangellales bacterium]|nr:MMPL family transporter [Jiangellales bacterium]
MTSPTRLLRLGRACARHPWRVLGAWVLLIAAVLSLAGAFGGRLSNQNTLPGSETQAAADLLAERFPAAGGSSATLVVQGPADVAADPAVEELAAAVADLPGVDAVGEPVPSPDGRTVTIGVHYPVAAPQVGADGVAELEGLLEAPREAGLHAEVGGEVVFANTEAPTGVAEAVGLSLALLVLVVAFGSVVAAGLPVAVALAGIAVGSGAMLLVARVVDVPADAPQIATMIGLGVGVDYALVLVSRHRELLATGLEVDEAAGMATATAGRAVVLAGGTVVVALLGLWLTGLPFVGLLGTAASAVVALAVVASVTLVPALLGLADRRVLGRRARRHARARQAPSAAPRPPLAARWAARVTRRPLPYAVVGTALLLALAAPVLGMRFGQPDAGLTDPSGTQRRAYDLIAGAYGPGANGPLVVVVPGAEDTERVARAVELLAADPGVAAVGEPVVGPAGDTVVVTVLPTTAPQDPATEQLVHRMRADLDQVGTDVLLTGPTAGVLDLGRALADRLPLVVGAVVALSALLLLVVFGSVVVPVKAALLNLLAIGAAFGALVVVFQWGWGLGLVGLTETQPVVSFVPVFLFAVVFGLSMDYEVFLLSRVREEYTRTRDPVHAVTEGTARTARVITSAAAIMVAVFAAFVAGPEPLLKMFGFGLAVAVLIDATVVRLLLVPSAMALLGHRAWWAPPWLTRRLPGVDLEAPGLGSADRPVPDRLPAPVG